MTSLSRSLSGGDSEEKELYTLLASTAASDPQTPNGNYIIVNTVFRVAC